MGESTRAIGRKPAWGLRGAIALMGAWGLSLLACGRPTRVDWSVCTASDQTCLAGFTCDTTTWTCVATSGDGGVDARDASPADGNGRDGPAEEDGAVVDGGTSDGGKGDALGDGRVDTKTGCDQSSDCTSPVAPVCDPTTRRCVGCLLSADCKSETTPACDTSTHTCVGCVSAGDCVGSTKACDTVSHTCVACASSADCTGPAKICDVAAHACVGCLASGDCRGDAKVCDVGVHACVGCLSSGDCGGNTKVCDVAAHACVGCLASSDCAAPTAVCDTSVRACVGCLGDEHCGGQKPFCDKEHKTCVPCASDQSCAAKSTTAPACAMTGTKAGACVACTDSKKHCLDGAAPVCDGATNTCRACSRDAECAAGYGPNPGLCVEGRCLDDAQTLYVQAGGTCASADGTAAKPFCSLSDAMGFLSADRHTILVRGTMPVGGSPVPFMSPKVLLVGQGGATIAGPTTSALLSLASGELTVRDLTVSGATQGAGISATGGVLRLLRARVLGNAESGVVTKNAAFDIENTIVAGNGGSNNPGVNLGALPAGVSGPAVFVNNTVIGNGLIGVACGGAFTLANSIISANGTAQISAGCVFNDVCSKDCSAAPALDATTYHLTAASTACFDKVNAGAPADDIDGDARPAQAADCGADELASR